MQALIDHARALAGQHPQARIVVVADRHTGADLVRLTEGLEERCLVLAPEADPVWRLTDRELSFSPAPALSSVAWQLKLHGPVDLLLVMNTQSTKETASWFNRLFPHVASGGHYLTDRRRTTDSSGSGLVASLATLISIQEDDQRGTRREREFARSVGRLTVDPDWIGIEKTERHWLMVREENADRILGERCQQLGVSVERRLKGLSFTMPGTVTHHGVLADPAGFDTTIDVPSLELRRYQGRSGMISNQLFVDPGSNTALPPSFRHHRTKDLVNPMLEPVTGEFGRIPDHRMPTEDLGGSYYLLDAENSGHFGHLMTEVVSRLWGWDEAKRRDPDLKALFRIRTPLERDPMLERRLFSAYGIAEEDITWIDSPRWLEDARAATPMFHNATPHYVHPGFRNVMRRITLGLTDGVVRETPVHRRIFVSRRPGTVTNRTCTNAAEIEQLFEKHGYAVVYPEELDLAQQAWLFRSAEVVAGFGGSGLFNIAHCDDLQDLVVLNSESYTARNEHLFAMTLGCDETYFWGEAEIKQPSDGWSVKAYKAPWSLPTSSQENAPLHDLLRRTGRRFWSR